MIFPGWHVLRASSFVEKRDDPLYAVFYPDDSGMIPYGTVKEDYHDDI